jgi:hypothetical protein
MKYGLLFFPSQCSVFVCPKRDPYGTIREFDRRARVSPSYYFSQTGRCSETQCT